MKSSRKWVCLVIEYMREILQAVGSGADREGLQSFKVSKEEGLLFTALTHDKTQGNNSGGFKFPWQPGAGYCSLAWSLNIRGLFKVTTSTF